uniref:Uncharacterized protein n=1 Tax=Molossus molossus TaxID=27622 RepID=A0A7J8FRR6_MOLMO|nr:hypothetical protein HJG59_008328 [Molossus molossus]
MPTGPNSQLTSSPSSWVSAGVQAHDSSAPHTGHHRLHEAVPVPVLNILLSWGERQKSDKRTCGNRPVINPTALCFQDHQQFEGCFVRSIFGGSQLHTTSRPSPAHSGAYPRQPHSRPGPCPIKPSVTWGMTVTGEIGLKMLLSESRVAELNVYLFFF